jgi:hypothetical protein
MKDQYLPPFCEKHYPGFSAELVKAPHPQIFWRRESTTPPDFLEA